MILYYSIWQNYQTGTTYSATPLCQTMYQGNLKLGWPYHGPRNYGGYPDNTDLVVGKQVTNSGDSGLKTTILGYTNIPLGSNEIFDMKLETKGNNFNIYYNNTLLFNVQDSSYK